MFTTTRLREIREKIILNTDNKEGVALLPFLAFALL